MNKKIEKFIFVYFIFYLLPAGMAVLGALFELPNYYYTLFKMLMIVTDSGGFNLVVLSDTKRRPYNTDILYLGVCIVTFIITMLGIISMIKSGFPREFWIVLDFIFATAKIIQLIIVSKYTD